MGLVIIAALFAVLLVIGLIYDARRRRQGMPTQWSDRALHEVREETNARVTEATGQVMPPDRSIGNPTP